MTNWTQSPSASPRLRPVSPGTNPHTEINTLAGFFFFVTYILMMDDDIQDESLILGDFEEDEELEEDEKY